MRILRIYNRYPPMPGGMEKHIFYLTQEQRKNHYVKVIFNEGEAQSEFDVKIGSFPYGRIKPAFVGVFLFYFNVLFEILKKREKFDVIHIHGDWSSLVFAKVVKKITNAKVVLFSIHDKLRTKKLYNKLMSHFLKNVGHVLSTGYEAGSQIRSLMKDKEVTVQPSGVSQIFFEVPEGREMQKEIDIVTVANINPKKNIEFVVDLAKNNKEFSFVVIGFGPLYSSIKDKIQKLGLDNIKMLGAMSAVEIRGILDKSSCFLLTSFEEGTPTAILEAMVRGLPIVTSDAGGIQNIIKNNENGFVLNRFSVEDYSEKLRMILKDKDLYNNMRKNNMAVSENFGWNKVAERITKITESVLK